jgi:hypothetical protein
VVSVTEKALLIPFGDFAIFLDSAEAVVRMNDELAIFKPSRAALTEPGFRLLSVGDERRDGMLAIVAASSTVGEFVLTILLGMRDGYPMDTGSCGEGDLGRALGMDGGRRPVSTSSEGGDSALSDGVLADHLLIIVCFFSAALQRTASGDSSMSFSLLLRMLLSKPLTSRILLPRIAKNFSAAAAFWTKAVLFCGFLSKPFFKWPNMCISVSLST